MEVSKTLDGSSILSAPVWTIPGNACKMGVPAIISADAHHFSEITLEFAAAEEALKKAGYRSVVNFKEGSWIEVGLS